MLTHTVRRLIIGLVIVTLFACSNPDAEYKSALEMNNIKSYQAVLKKYPQHSQSPQALKKLMVLLEYSRKEGNFFLINTICSAKSFLK